MTVLGDIQKMKQNMAQKVRTKELDEDLKALQANVGAYMLANSEELIHAYIIYGTEYLPLAQGIAGILARASAMEAQARK